MRRKIEVFLLQTDIGFMSSLFSLDTFFSSLLPPPAARGPSARGAYMLRKSFVLVFIRFRVKARQHDQGFKTVPANPGTDQLTHRSTVPLIHPPPCKNF